MVRRVALLAFVFWMCSGAAGAGSIEDTWGAGGSLEWLRNGTPTAGLILLDPDDYYFSSHFEDATLPADSYLDAGARTEWPSFIGVEVDTEDFTNLGFLRVDDPLFAIGVLVPGVEIDNPDYAFYGSLVNSGAIYALAATDDTETSVEAIAAGIILARPDENNPDEIFPVELVNGTLTNTGNILAEVVLADLGADELGDSALAGAVGIAVFTLDGSTVATGSSVAARIAIENTEGYVDAHAGGIFFENLLNGSALANTGAVLAEVVLADLGTDNWGYSADGWAFGIEAGTIDGSTVTTGSSVAARVAIENTEGYVDAWAGGIYFDELLNDSALTNTGAVLAEVFLSDIGANDGGESAWVWAFGIEGGAVDGSTITTGSSVTARITIGNTLGEVLGEARGLYFSDLVDGSEVTNAGEVLAEVILADIGGGGVQNAQVHGLKFDQNVTDVMVSNAGLIGAGFTVAGGELDGALAAKVFGVKFDGAIDSSSPLLLLEDNDNDALPIGSAVVNEGTILAHLDLSPAFVATVPQDEETILYDLEVGGLCLGWVGEAAIENVGLIDVEVKARGFEVEDGRFLVTGLSAWGGEGIDIVNEGVIRLNIADLGTTDDLIDDTRTGAAVLLAGVTDAVFSNTGSIRTSGNARALSLYGSTVTLGDGFGYVFHGNPETVKRPIYISADSVLDLNDVDLLVHIDPRTLVFDKPYFLIDSAGNGGLPPLDEYGAAGGCCFENLVGEWGELVETFKSQSPDVSVAWYVEEQPLNGQPAGEGEEPALPDKGLNSAVVFSFEPTENQGVISAAAALTGIYSVQNQFMSVIRDSNIRGSGFFREIFSHVPAPEPILLASAGPLLGGYGTAEAGASPQTGFYALPYYTRVGDSGLGARMNTAGVLFALEQKLEPMIGGLIFGYGRNDVKFTGVHAGNNEDHDVWTLGAYGLFEPENDWFANFVANYHHLRHDYTGWSLGNRETDKYTSNTLMAQSEVGLKFEDSGHGWGIYPAAGLRWSYWRTGSRVTSLNRVYESYDKHYFHLLAGVDAAQKWERADDLAIELSGGLKLEQALGGNKVSVAQTLGGTRTVTSQDIGSSSLIGNIALNWLWERSKFKIGLMGQHNSDYRAFSTYAQFGLTW